jgi:hypothetical protein
MYVCLTIFYMLQYRWRVIVICSGIRMLWGLHVWRKLDTFLHLVCLSNWICGIMNPFIYIVFIFYYPSYMWSSNIFLETMQSWSTYCFYLLFSYLCCIMVTKLNYVTLVDLLFTLLNKGEGCIWNCSKGKRLNLNWKLST